MSTNPRSYWSNRGLYKQAYETLLARIPDSGECDHAEGANRALDRLRRASNCYYDLHNNGLCNRAAEFRALFKVGRLPRKYCHYMGRHGGMGLDFNTITEQGKVDAAMDAFILAAAKEQGVACEPAYNDALAG